MKVTMSATCVRDSTLAAVSRLTGAAERALA
jgi:hypothetical protein